MPADAWLVAGLSLTLNDAEARPSAENNTSASSSTSRSTIDRAQSASSGQLDLDSSSQDGSGSDTDIVGTGLEGSHLWRPSGRRAMCECRGVLCFMSSGCLVLELVMVSV